VKQAIRNAARLLSQQVADDNLPPSAINPFRHTQAERNEVSRLLREWIQSGKLGTDVTLGDLSRLTSVLVGLGPLDTVARDPSVISIQVQGYDSVLVQRSGVWQETDVGWGAPGDLRVFGEALAARSGKELTPESPVCQASFENPPGRIQIDGTARNQAHLTIHVRLGRQEPITLMDMQAGGSLSADMYDFLVAVAKRKIGVLVVGVPGTGKTTLLEAWVAHWPDQPAVALDDRSEFYPQHRQTVVYDVPAEQLARACAHALRKNVDRLLVAEVRGNEAAEMLRYSASMPIWTTLHANVGNAVARLMGLCKAEGSPYANVSAELLRELIAVSFPLIVETEKLVVGGQAIFFVSQIAHLTADGTTRPLFKAEVQGGKISFVETGDPDGFLEDYPRRIYGGVGLPKLETLAKLVEKDPGLALAGIGEMLRVLPSDERVLGLMKRLVREREDIRAMIRSAIKEKRTAIRDAVESKDWARALRLLEQARSNPLVKAIGSEVTTLKLSDVPGDELRARLRNTLSVEEVLDMTSGVQRVLALLGAMERVDASPEHFDGRADTLYERLDALQATEALHLRGLGQRNGGEGCR
jgi:pilus assembly protein CpaF